MFSHRNSVKATVAKSVSLFAAQVKHMWYDGELREIMISDTWRKYIKNAGFHNLARVASLCNRAEWEPLAANMPVPPLRKRKILGDASDAALLKCMEVLVKGGADAYRKSCTKVFNYDNSLLSSDPDVNYLFLLFPR